MLNDAPALAKLLDTLHCAFNDHGPQPEIVVVDGGSTDGGAAIAQQHGCEVVVSHPGRGVQLQAGFVQAQGDWIWFLHADSQPGAELAAWLQRQTIPGWGRFDVRFTADAWLFRLIASMMNWRSRRTGICTGDQGMFVHRSLLEAVGGVPSQPLMEDIELSKRLKREKPPLCPRVCLSTSSRRWEQRGVVRTIVSMWWFRLRYWLGADPLVLAKEYYS